MWHHPAIGGHKVHLLLVWREDSRTKRKKGKGGGAGTDVGDEAEQQRKARRNKGKDGKDADNAYRKGIVIESCRSEIDAEQLNQLTKNWLDALGTCVCVQLLSLLTLLRNIPH